MRSPCRHYRTWPPTFSPQLLAISRTFHPSTTILQPRILSELSPPMIVYRYRMTANLYWFYKARCCFTVQQHSLLLSAPRFSPAYLLILCQRSGGVSLSKIIRGRQFSSSRLIVWICGKTKAYQRQTAANQHRSWFLSLHSPNRSLRQAGTVGLVEALLSNHRQIIWFSKLHRTIWLEAFYISALIFQVLWTRCIEHD